MYIRCAECKTPTWIPSLVPGEAGASADCQSCGRSYSLDRAAELGGTAREQYTAAREFAKENEVDLPGAYSVLLGIMPLDDAREAKGRTAEKPAAPRQPAPPEFHRPVGAAMDTPELPPELPPAPRELDSDSLPFDPGFGKAIAEGLLTVQQAIERGDRKTWATRIASRHGMTIDEAYQVADNRESLHSAILRQPPKIEVIPPRVKPKLNGRQRALVCFLALVLFGAIGFHSWQSYRHWADRSDAVAIQQAAAGALPAETAAVADPEPGVTDGEAVAEETSREVPRAEVVRGPGGRIVRVEGSDPRSVLIAYCRNASAEGQFEALELTSSIPPMSGTRMGIFRNYRRTDRLFAIRIRRDNRTSRWYAGDGKRPLRPQEAPELPASARRIPVSPSS